jgi:HEAT repeat protein
MKNGVLLVFGTLALATMISLTSRLVAAADAGDDAVQMIVTLLHDKDKEVRALGLQQVREEAKGPAATRRFVAALPALPPAGQVELLDALADRGDNAARPALLEMQHSAEEQVRAAVLRALGPLGSAADVPLLVSALAAVGEPEKTAAQGSLVRLRGEDVNAAIAAAMKGAKPEIRAELVNVLALRRATQCLPQILDAGGDTDAGVRSAAVAALGQLAGPAQIPGMLKIVLNAEEGLPREAAEKAVMFVCNRIEDPSRRGGPLLAALAQFGEDDQTALLPTLGRVGGPAALKIVEAAMAAKSPSRQEAGIRALCNWPDASVAAGLLNLAQTAGDADQRLLALRALIRVAALPDRVRSDAERLTLLKKAMAMATRGTERKLVLRRCRAVRTMESLRFVAPYLEQPEYAQEACATVVELAHHRKLREPNKAEFDPLLDAVIRISKDADLVDRAKRYRKGQT